MRKLIIPTQTIPYILYQRTHYLKKKWLNKKILSRIEGLSGVAYKFLVLLKTILFSPLIRKGFQREIEGDMELIKKYIPDHATSILDIGCGVAGIDIYLSKFYSHKTKLLD